MRRSTLLALLAFGLAACTGGASDGASAADSLTAAPPASASVDTTRAGRAAAAGLSAAQVDSLAVLGFPVLVPSDPGAFRPVAVWTEQTPVWEYVVTYRRDDGACIEVAGVEEGMDEMRLPALAREVSVPALGRTFTLFDAGRDPASDDPENWGMGTVVSDWLDLDGLRTHLISRYDEGLPCAPVSAEDLAAFAATLRPLDPADDAGIDGAWDELEIAGEEEEIGSLGGPDPAVVARRLYARPEEAGEVTVETVRETPYRAVVMVTRLGLMDDSIRDERLRVLYRRNDTTGDWEPIRMRRQHRCQSGRGHAEWSNASCV